MSGEAFLRPAHGGFLEPPSLDGLLRDLSRVTAWSAGRTAERRDTIALIERRIANCALVEDWSSEAEPLAADRRRQLEVLRDELRGELHVGEFSETGGMEGEARTLARSTAGTPA